MAVAGFRKWTSTPPISKRSVKQCDAPRGNYSHRYQLTRLFMMKFSALSVAKILVPRLEKVLHSTFRGSFAKVAYVLETVDALTDSIFASDAAEERSKSYARSFQNVAPVLLDILDDASGGTTTKDGSKDSEIRRSICASVVRLLKPFTLDKNSDTATMTLVGKKHDLVEPVKSMHVSSDTSNECTIEGVTLPKDALRDFAVAATSRVLRCAAAFQNQVFDPKSTSRMNRFSWLWSLTGWQH